MEEAKGLVIHVSGKERRKDKRKGWVKYPLRQEEVGERRRR
jgi:hypothetical protein